MFNASIGKGRLSVRAMTASIFGSRMQLSAAAEDAARPIPAAVRKTSVGEGNPGVAINMPITAVKTIRVTTRGLPRLNSDNRCGCIAPLRNCVGLFIEAAVKRYSEFSRKCAVRLSDLESRK